MLDKYTCQGLEAAACQCQLTVEFRPMRLASFVMLIAGLFVVACNRAPAPAPPAAAPPPFRPVADVKQLMASVIEPAAEIYWDAVGSITDKNGTVEIAPKSEDEWIAVRNSAYVVAESGNLLMMDPRARDRGEWYRPLAVADRSRTARHPGSGGKECESGLRYRRGSVRRVCGLPRQVRGAADEAERHEQSWIVVRFSHPVMSLLSFVEWLASTRWSIALHESFSTSIPSSSRRTS